ncbi:MAG: lipocalin family protein [Flavobacteriaceae bacterium]
MIRRIILVFLVVPLFLISCNATKGVPSTKGTAKLQKTLNGAWTLNTVTYEGNDGKFSSILFNDADASCFEGTYWYFRNNNNTGSYVIDPTNNCSGGERFIRWSILNSGQLQFKSIDSNYKDISGGLGYRMDVALLEDTQMTLKSRVSVDGEPITVVYSFTKN